MFIYLSICAHAYVLINATYVAINNNCYNNYKNGFSFINEAFVATWFFLIQYFRARDNSWRGLKSTVCVIESHTFWLAPFFFSVEFKY